MEFITCPTCGESLPARATFCKSCGTRLRPADEEAPAQPQPDAGDAPAPDSGIAAEPEAVTPPQISSLAPESLNTALQEGAITLAGPDTAALAEPEADTSLQAGDALPKDLNTAPPDDGALPKRQPAGAAWAGALSQPGAPAKASVPARKKRKTGLLVLVAVLLLIVIAGGVLGVAFANQKHLLGSKPTASVNTPTPTLTPTPNRTLGFLQFSTSTYRLLYPGGWATLPGESGGGNDKEFIGPDAQKFQITIGPQLSGQPTPQVVDDVTCQTFFGTQIKPGAPTPVSIHGQQWTREECEGTATNGKALHVIAESLAYKNQIYTLSYASSPASFADDQQQFYAPMEESFTLLT